MIYLDNNATTRPCPAAAEAVALAMERLWANPSSVHRAGQEVRRAVELARRDVAALIGADPKQIIFTASGTESIDLAIRGILGGAALRAANQGSTKAEGQEAAPRAAPPVVISTKIEHAAVRDLLQDLHSRGQIEAVWAPLLPAGVVDTAALEAHLDEHAAPESRPIALVSIQWANNETGVIQPVHEIARICRARRIPFHCDAVQWVGKEAGGLRLEAGGRSEDTAVPGLDPQATGNPPDPATSSLKPQASSLPTGLPDCLSLSPHKFHGPKGVGVLWVRRGLRLRPTIQGAQELGRRGGTENVPGILGAGAAAREAMKWLADPAARARQEALRDRLERGILRAVPDAVVNGVGVAAEAPESSPSSLKPQVSRLWNTSNIGFPRLEAEALLMLLSERGLCASAGAACSSGSLEPSPVLLAMGVPPEVAHGSIRLSLSRETTQREVDEAVAIIADAAARLGASMPGA